MGNRGERRARPASPGGRAPGRPARRRRPGAPPARRGSRVAMASATACCSSAPRRHRSSKPRSASAPRPSSWHRLDPEVLFVQDARAPPARRRPWRRGRTRAVGAVGGSVRRSAGRLRRGPVQVASTSVMETSRYAPSPLVTRPRTAAQIPKAAVMPAARSAVGSGGTCVAVPPSGVKRPRPRLVVHVVARQKRRAGRAARSRRSSSRRCRGSGPARRPRRGPRRASTPGRNPSTSTSACVASSSALARAATSLRSSSRLRLPRVDRGEETRVVAHRVPARWLDLQHVGAQRHQQRRGVRSGAPDAQVEDPEPGEKLRVAGHRPESCIGRRVASLACWVSSRSPR